MSCLLQAAVDRQILKEENVRLAAEISVVTTWRPADSTAAAAAAATDAADFDDDDDAGLRKMKLNESGMA